MIAVQTITSTWTKLSRGGSMATSRSRIPKQLPLLLADETHQLHWHSIAYSEGNNFAEPIAVKVATTCHNNRFGCDNAEIEIRDDGATLTYRYHTGAPARQFFSKTGNYVAPEYSIKVLNGQWASIEYNGRFSCIDTGNWWYEHVVVNVAVGVALSANVFLVSTPIENYSQLAHLR